MVSRKCQDVVDIRKAADERGELRMHDPVDFGAQLHTQLVDRRQNMEYVAEGAEFYDEDAHVQILVLGSWFLVLGSRFLVEQPTNKRINDQTNKLLDELLLG